MTTQCKNKNKYTAGALLLELLVVISILTVILAVSANGILLSLKSNKIAGERDVANALAAEAIEAVRATSDENWQNVYSLTKSSQHYKTTLSGTKWILSTGDESISLNGTTYTRYITINNVSRDTATRAIQTSYSSSDDDPSTQKITVVVSWSGGSVTVASDYVFRWRNKICDQTDWTTGGSGTTVKLCTDGSYDTKDASIDVTGGTLKLQ